MSIGGNIKMIRKEKKITQSDLAEQIGISRSYLGDLENDRRNPSATTLESLAKKLDVSMLYLLEGKKTVHDLSEIEKQALENELMDLKSTVIPNHVKNMFDSIDFNSLELEQILYLQDALFFMRTFDKKLISSFYSIFRESIRIHSLLSKESKLKNDVKEGIIEMLLVSITESSNEIVENMKKNLYKKIQEN